VLPGSFRLSGVGLRIFEVLEDFGFAARAVL
jgi:hypothetical protein